MTEPAHETEYAVKLTVHRKKDGGCYLEADRERYFAVRNEDEIHMVEPLASGQRMKLFLEMADGTPIEGISMGKTSEDARNAEPSRDTGGDYYGDTPFTISPASTGASVLTVIRDASNDRYQGRLWFFDLCTAVTRASGRRIDPKIYNKGDEL